MPAFSFCKTIEPNCPLSLPRSTFLCINIFPIKTSRVIHREGEAAGRKMELKVKGNWMRAYWADAIWAFGGRRDRGGKVAPMSSTVFSAFAKWSRSRYTIAKWGEELPHNTHCVPPSESDKQYPKKEAF